MLPDARLGGETGDLLQRDERVPTFYMKSLGDIHRSSLVEAPSRDKDDPAGDQEPRMMLRSRLMAAIDSD